MRLYDYAASGNCYKARLLLALLGRDYERVPVDIFAGDTLTDDYARLNPLRETPVLELDDGTALPQSNAILGYLAEGTPWLPDDAVQRAQVVAWLFFEQERIMTVGGVNFRLSTGRPGAGERMPAARAGVAILDAHLAGREWVVGSAPSIADISLYAYGQLAPEIGIDLAEHQELAAWLQRLRALPRFVDDLIPYPDNARLGVSSSIYDA
jgi:glutathione S-transferase